MSERMTVDDLFRMYHEVCDNAFLGFEERWGEPFPLGDWKTASLAIRHRIEQAILDEGLKEHRARVDGLVEAAGEYLSAVELAMPAINACIHMSTIHGAPYTGPNITPAATQLRDAVDAALAAVRESQVSEGGA